jgi:hypothetical protein
MSFSAVTSLLERGFDVLGRCDDASERAPSAFQSELRIASPSLVITN